MSFKEDLEADIKDTFLLEDEFAEQHCIDGVELSASVVELNHERRRRNLQSYERSIYNKQTVVSVAASDFGELPAVSRPLMLDGKQYLVKEAKEEYGMYRIVLEVT